MLHFELVTPERLVRSEEVHMVVVPGTDGDFGVLEGHAPFMSTIRDGAVQVFKTADPKHPGVKMVMEQGDVNLAGPVQVLSVLKGGDAPWSTPTSAPVSAFSSVVWSPTRMPLVLPRSFTRYPSGRCTRSR